MASRTLKTQIRELVKQVPEDKQLIAKQIADELVFIDDTMGKLKTDIKKNGVTEHFVNGKQDFWRESTSLKAYTALVPRFSTLWKQLTDLLPKDVNVENASAVLEFIKA